MVGTRDADAASEFPTNLASFLANRVQLTSDGHRACLSAVDNAFHWNVDYAMLVKRYGNEVSGNTPSERKYSPNECIGIRNTTICGDPDPKHISTSFAERLNLTMRRGRFTRLTNGFSKKVENHMHTVAMHFFH